MEFKTLSKVITACVVAGVVSGLLLANATFYEVLMGQLSQWAETQSLLPGITPRITDFCTYPVIDCPKLVNLTLQCT